MNTLLIIIIFYGATPVMSTHITTDFACKNIQKEIHDKSVNKRGNVKYEVECVKFAKL